MVSWQSLSFSLSSWLAISPTFPLIHDVTVYSSRLQLIYRELTTGTALGDLRETRRARTAGGRAKRGRGRSSRFSERNIGATRRLALSRRVKREKETCGTRDNCRASRDR